MEGDFIGFEEARSRLIKNVKTLGTISVPVKECCGYVLARDIYAPIDLPPWDNSAVDGFAINTSSIENLPARLKITGEIKTGKPGKIVVGIGESVRVYTGGVIPVGANAVVKIEDVVVHDDMTIEINRFVEAGSNIRRRGEEIPKGNKVISRGTFIHPGVAGFISIMGIPKVRVFRKPSVAVISTGDEIMEPGHKLKYGMFYDANLTILISFLKRMGISEVWYKHCADDFALIKRIFKRIIGKYDIVIFTGGISVGKYDMVRQLIKEEKVRKIFYKVRQKPGKPLFVGKKNRTLIFGLPGNPAAVLTTFYEYVSPAIKKMMGFKDIFPPEEEKILANDVKKEGSRLAFLKGKIEGDYVMCLEHQGSHMLSSFVDCNCFIVIPEGVSVIRQGEKVKVHRIIW